MLFNFGQMSKDLLHRELHCRFYCAIKDKVHHFKHHKELEQEFPIKPSNDILELLDNSFKEICCRKIARRDKFAQLSYHMATTDCNDSFQIKRIINISLIRTFCILLKCKIKKSKFIPVAKKMLENYENTVNIGSDLDMFDKRKNISSFRVLLYENDYYNNYESVLHELNKRNRAIRFPDLMDPTHLHDYAIH